jgi:hypothetical protein
VCQQRLVRDLDRALRLAIAGLAGPGSSRSLVAVDGDQPTFGQ